MIHWSATDVDMTRLHCILSCACEGADSWRATDEPALNRWRRAEQRGAA
jgi:hypothetical protein